MAFLQKHRRLPTLFMPIMQSRRAVVLLPIISLVLLICLWSKFSLNSPYHIQSQSAKHESPPGASSARPSPWTHPAADPEKPPAPPVQPAVASFNFSIPNLDAVLKDPLCANRPDTSNIAVVMKTGATEAFARLPTQFMTVLRCIDDYLVFSDMEQTIAGVHVRDSLDTMLPEAQRGNRDFDLYRAQKTCAVDQGPCTSGFNRAEAGWNLDKYKNIHMAEKTWALRPDKDWYLFIDADTYVVWNTLVAWLARLDPKQKLYLGSEALINDFSFAHGGSGYVLSRAAMEAFVGKNKGVGNKYDVMTMDQCCGDYVMSLAAKEVANISITQTWPILNGEKPFTLPFGHSHWCHPIATMHHMSTQEISDFWEYEMGHYSASSSSSSAPRPMLMKDIYRDFFAPRLEARRPNWDNLSDERLFFDRLAGDWKDWQLDRNPSEDKKTDIEKEAHLSAENCARACEATTSCYQYSYSKGLCGFSFSFRLGAPVSKKKSEQTTGMLLAGWDVKKIKKWVEEHDKCDRIIGMGWGGSH